METITEQVQWLVFFNDQILIEKRQETFTLPQGIKPPVEPEKETIIHSMTTPKGVVCKAFTIDHEFEENERFFMTGLRASYDCLPYSQYQAAGKAHEIIHWDKNSNFCPACGTPTEKREPIMKKCPKCGNELYPAISTAILALVRKENSILLVHALNFRGTFNSLVAGFLETGETLEECVAREVLEETGLKVKNITYFGNQPWPYPSGLMVGFIADYESGEIELQKEELSSGAFYAVDNLPEIPRKMSLARKMIDWWIEEETKTDRN
ncbi:NAD(+) diphosphatase [uncultured Bacteroides sp.]|uniref:NAD(+) diphosphatase n=1 Tax=uncultured Bacteroides sp. TaxID=162156 RepID=UPI002AAB352E|nr:NAD(+) diphosphatase [uncultured Bacteroides sp.]